MTNPPFPGDFDSLARQYWNTWNEMLGRSGGFDGWKLPGGMAQGIGNAFAGNPFAGNAFSANPFAASLAGMNGGLPPGLAGFDPGAYEWYQRMQRLAADFSNGGAAAAEIANAWREMMGQDGPHSFARMLRSMHGGLAGSTWMDQVRPMLDTLLRPLREQGSEWLQRPAFGPLREHQERLQALALAWQEWDKSNEDFNQLLVRVGQDAFARFEVMLQECDQPGKRLESARALFDLWIDAAEEAWAELALGDEYRQAYGAMTNAMMRLRLGLQQEVERFGALLGLPGRTEVDALARKVADLERAQHAARRAARVASTTKAAAPARVSRPVAAVPATRPAAAKPAVAAPAPAPVPVPQPAASATRKQAAAKRSKAKPAASRKAAPKRSAARKAARPAKPAPAKAARPVKPANAAPARAAAAATRSPSRSAPAKAARSATAARKPAPAAPGATKVVSMKDWVSRNLPGIEPPVAPAPSGKSGRK